MVVSERARSGWAVNLAARTGLHYGWIVVGVVFLALLVSSAVRQVPGVVIRPLEAEFGWDRAAVSLVVAVSILIGGLASPYSGQLMDRFGPRSVLIAGVLLIGVISSALRLESVTVNVINIIIGLLLVASVISPSVLAGVSGIRARRNRRPGTPGTAEQLPPVGADTQGR